MKLYPSTLHFPFSAGADGRTSQVNWWDMVDRCSNLINLEKLDGRLVCFTSYGVFDKDSQLINAEERPDLWNVYSIIASDLKDTKFFAEDLYTIRSVEYWDITSYVYMFAACTRELWLSWDSVKFLADFYGLQTVPVINEYYQYKGTEEDFKKSIINLAKSPSNLVSFEAGTSEHCSMEGIITRNKSEFPIGSFNSNVLKYKSKDEDIIQGDVAKLIHQRK